MDVVLEAKIRDISEVQGVKNHGREIEMAKCEVLEVRQCG